MKKLSFLALLMAIPLMVGCGDSPGDGGKGFSSEVNLIAPNLSTLGLSDELVRISLSDVNGLNEVEVNMVLQRKSSGQFQDIWNVDTSEAIFNDTNVRANTAYEYRIKVATVESINVDPVYSDVLIVETPNIGVIIGPSVP